MFYSSPAVFMICSENGRWEITITGPILQSPIHYPQQCIVSICVVVTGCLHIIPIEQYQNGYNSVSVLITYTERPLALRTTTVKLVYKDTLGATKMCCYNQVVAVTRTFSAETIESVPAMCVAVKRLML